MNNARQLSRSLAPDELVREVRDRFGSFLRERVDPGAGERDRSGAPFSGEILAEAGALGLLGFTVPPEVGGSGRSWREWGLVLHEIGYLSADTSFPMLLAYCGTLTKLLHETGRPDITDRYVLPMARGALLGGFAWSEGHDPFSFRTVLRKTGQGYVLTGEKLPVADGQIAGVFMVFARSAETSDVVAVLVERDDPGVEITPYLAMGLRAAGMARVAFREVALPEERVIVPADALSYGQRFLNERRLEMPCWALGKMRRLFENCVDELAHRIRYRLPVTEMQAVQAAIGRMAVGLETSRMVLDRALDHIGRGAHDRLWDPELAVAKVHVIGQALAMCRTLQDILGGAGVLEAYPYERPIRDLLCLNAIAGTLATLEVDLGIVAVGDIERGVRSGRLGGRESR
jgi:alkylation response protein AidB-like acyl-CoA dehydrogenase